MGDPGRDAAVNINQNSPFADRDIFPGDVENFNFYQLVELLHRLEKQDPESEEWESQCRLVFSANPSLGFSPSDVSTLSVLDDQRLKLQTNFFGLAGAQSPLPGFMLEELASEDEFGLRRQFLDFFNNRLITLVYRVWRKYRYYVRFQEEAKDQFSAQLFAFVGLADQGMRGDTPINWCKMLAYSGTLAGRSRSPQVVVGIISHCFDLPEVSIRQWVKRKVPIQKAQRIQLGIQNCDIGENTVLGSSVNDIKGKFAIQIKGLDKNRFADFLPLGREFLSLCKLVEFILREQMAYDLELTLKENEAPTMSLGNGNVSLGWSSFLGESKHKLKQQREKKVVIQVRQ
ncbi:type VI secretion system baseplate subunit TssG [Marinomonas primoryensis]|uniref:type VI secretion system baseplate subunit TssG n=1 Tax=Marinomonas primoryensis TaxID=178399 RepID=UPI0037037D26